MSPEIFFFFAVCFLPAYLVGSVPFGYIFGYLQGIDIRNQGSGNIGATNVWRVLGKRWGICTFFLDFLKVPISAYITYPFAHKFFPAHAPQLAYDLGAVFVFLGAVIGHNHPLWLRFKGGKGIATSAGGLLWLMPHSFLVVLLIWIVVFAIFRIVSLASIVAAVVLPPATLLFFGGGVLFWFCIVLATLAIMRHRANLDRLRKGTEPRWQRSSASIKNSS